MERQRKHQMSTLNRSSYIFLNSESDTINQINGNNAQFSFDVARNLPHLDVNKEYNIYIKDIFFKNSIYQLDSTYNYNRIRVEAYRSDTNAVVNNTTLTLLEGSYDVDSFISQFQTILNAWCTNNNYNTYSVGYNSYQNQITFNRNTLSFFPTTAYYIHLRFRSDDALSRYNGTFGFGLSWIIGLAKNSFYNLPTIVSANPALVWYSPPNQLNLQPHTYLYISISNGISNLNYATDIPNINSVMYRIPLISKRFELLYIDSTNPEFTMYHSGNLPNVLFITLLDQYGNIVNLRDETSAWDLTLKVVPVD